MIAVVVPTVRPEQLKLFLEAWEQQFERYQVGLYIVHDGDTPRLEHNGKFYSVKDIMGDYDRLIYNKNDGVRNLGFAKAYKDGAEVIISLDDDTRPFGDTIGDHLKVLNTRQPISYMNSVDDVYMRGFPYWARTEAETVFSHGLWHGVYDFDASTQLPQTNHRKMPVPKGVLMPMCVMNVAFKAKVLPYYYQAPMFDDLNRFADIWSGWEVKKAIDDNGWAMVTGYSKVKHERASDPFVNLIKEAKGLKMNENRDDEYFAMYKDKIKLWQEFLGA